MTERIWHSGPPPHVGWWNASASLNNDFWRWWDGECWSDYARESYTIDIVLRYASVKWKSTSIQWTDYWPENARVPRIKP